MANITFPNEFYCPITLEIMKDPVIGPDGHTYERNAIESWLSTNNKSPITRKVMHTSNLIPNIALRNTIESLKNVNFIPQLENKLIAKPEFIDYTQDKITLSYDSKRLSNGNILINVTANPPAYPQCGRKKPATFICVLDVSGSMDSPVSISDGSKQESHGFSRLDLVKHSMKTIINCLDEDDHICIITFSDISKVVLDLTKMDRLGKASAISIINTIRTEGMTNIWDGLRSALEISKDEICKNSNTVIALLTDGEPNVNPPRGILETLRKKIKDENHNVSINTFGFGYNLDSKLLDDIASENAGTYGYIPDCTFVGTIFVNFMSNILASISINNKLEIKLLNSTIMKTNSITLGTNIGPIQYGQKRSFIFEINNTSSTDYLDIVLKTSDQDINLIVNNDNNGNHHELMVQYFRIKFIESINQAIKLYNLNNRVAESSDLLKSFYDEVIHSDVIEDGRIIALLKDIKSTDEKEGQIGKAFSRQDWYEKWGKHYVPSVSKAHVYQQCVNFKDPSMQLYGGRLFSEIQEKADNIFCSMPAPTPTCQTQNNYHSSPINMSSYYNSNGACFDGNGTVLMSNGCHKLVKHLKQGDICMVNNKSVTIKCVIRTKVNKNIDLVNINNLLITPWHPVKRNGDWIFPIDLAPTEKKYIDYVYNFVLDGNQSISVNNIECIGLGHGIMNDNIAEHPYYGTNLVIEDLKKIDGWENGFIELDNFTLDRDDTGYISKILVN